MRRLLILVALVALPAALRAEEKASRNEITLVGGVSLLDVSSESERSVDLPLPFPLPPLVVPPRPFPDIRIRGTSSLGGSFVFGARYSRYLMDRVAVEADFAVAPSHDLDTGFAVCLRDGRCLGAAEPDAIFPSGQRLAQGVAAYHYGAGLAFDLLKGDVRPILLAGAGAVSWTRPDRTDTDLSLRFGGGVKVYFGTLGVRLEVVDHVIPDQFLSGKTEHDVQARAGVLIRLR
jgi:hypothetical protein